MSLTYIVLNLLLQNGLESKKMESDSCDELTKSILLQEMKLLIIEIAISRMENNIWSTCTEDSLVEVKKIVREVNLLMC